MRAKNKVYMCTTESFYAHENAGKILSRFILKPSNDGVCGLITIDPRNK